MSVRGPFSISWRYVPQPPGLWSVAPGCGRERRHSRPCEGCVGAPVHGRGAGCVRAAGSGVGCGGAGRDRRSGLTPSMTKRPPPPPEGDDGAHAHHLHVLHSPRIQRSRRLRNRSSIPRIRRPILAAHPRVLVVRRRLPTVSVRTGLPVRPVPPVDTVLAVLPRRTSRAGRTWLTLRTRFTLRANGTRRADCPSRSGRSARTRRTGRPAPPWLPRRSRTACRAGRARNRHRHLRSSR